MQKQREMEREFKTAVIEALGYYVYCLVDPRTGKIFYIGKGYANRVFNHANEALNEKGQNLKGEQIREIHKEGFQVQYYIIRHGLTEEEAYLVESVLIDMFTFDKFNLENLLTNIQTGRHQWDKGIKTTEEINLLYDCGTLVPREEDRLLFININKTYNRGERENIYEATRKYWKLNGQHAMKSTHVLALYRGIVRAVFKPLRWYRSEEKGQSGRWEFDGQEIFDSPYLHKSVKNLIACGRNPISYYNM